MWIEIKIDLIRFIRINMNMKRRTFCLDKNNDILDDIPPGRYHPWGFIPHDTEVP